ncbi:MAG: CHAT domain-containing protein, partial [Cyanobacteria bacterium P01_C01_bin.73]
WREAIALYLDSGNPDTALGLWQMVGFAELRLGNLEDATEAFQQQIGLAQELGSDASEQEGWYWLGISYDNAQDYDQGLSAFETSLALAKAQNNTEAIGDVLTRMGLNFYWRSDYVTAEAHFRDALALYQSLDAQAEQMIVLSMLGQTFHTTENYRQAIDYHQASLAIATAVDDPEWQWTAHNYIGFGHYWLNEYAPAIDHYQRALTIVRDRGLDGSDEALLLFRLGEAYFFVGDARRSVDYHQQSLAIARPIGDRERIGQALNAMGGALYSLGEFERGLAAYREALEISQALNNRNDEANALSGVARYYALQEDYPAALREHQKVLSIFQEIGNRYNQGATLETIGTLQMQMGNYDQAIAAFQQRLEISQQDEERYGEGNSLLALGFASLLRGELNTAETYLRQSIAVLESIRTQLGDRDSLKVALFDAQGTVYSLLQRTLVAQAQPQAALVAAEQGRARAFAERLATQVENEADIITAEPPDIDKIREIAARQNTTLVQYSLVAGRPDLSPNYDDVLFIWVVQPTGEVNLRQGDLTQLDRPLSELVTVNRTSIGARGRGIQVVAANPGDNPDRDRIDEQAEATLKQLHRLLIEPIADLLPANPTDRVTIIPHQSLFLVPFPALQAEDGTYLIDRHTLLSAPSIQVLGLTDQLRPTQRSATGIRETLIVGNPTMPVLPALPGEAAPVLAPLPGAEQEAKAIAELLNTTALIGDQATEPAVVEKMPQADVIHLATHGLLDWGDPQALYLQDFPGAVALAPTATSDGLLTAAEILELDLQADLVILSACDTGQGRITGDGVVGLSRSLMVAGVPSVVVSLWAVPDAPTA